LQAATGAEHAHVFEFLGEALELGLQVGAVLVKLVAELATQVRGLAFPVFEGVGALSGASNMPAMMPAPAPARAASKILPELSSSR